MASDGVGLPGSASCMSARATSCLCALHTPTTFTALSFSVRHPPSPTPSFSPLPILARDEAEAAPAALCASQRASLNLMPVLYCQKATVPGGDRPANPTSKAPPTHRPRITRAKNTERDSYAAGPSALCCTAQSSEWYPQGRVRNRGYGDASPVSSPWLPEKKKQDSR